MIEKSNLQPESALLIEISALIEQGHSKIASQIYSTLTSLIWHMGKKINDFILEHKRGEY